MDVDACECRLAAFVTKKFTVRPLLRYLAIPQMNSGLEILRPLSEINEGLSWSAEPLSVGQEGNTNRPANHLATSYSFAILSGFILHK